MNVPSCLIPFHPHILTPGPRDQTRAGSEETMAGEVKELGWSYYMAGLFNLKEIKSLGCERYF